MSSVTIYTSDFCGYCTFAKRLLSEKGIEFTEINLQDKADELKLLRERTGWRTLPQIFINQKFIGGFDELRSICDEGGLEAMLNIETT